MPIYPVLFAALALILAGSVRAELPTPLSRFGNLPCLAPIIRAVDPEAPKNIGEALLLPPYRSIDSLEGIGIAHFPLTGVAPEAQAAFDLGVALLHGFDDSTAERAFRTAASLAPEHPMPYWGLAMANERRTARATVYIKYADHLAGRLENLSPREQKWVEAYGRYFAPYEPGSPDNEDANRRRARVAALEDLAYDHPDDTGAKAFLLRELVLDEHRAAISVGSHYAVDAIAASLLETNPQHPAANYRPLLWLRDRPERAARFAPAAIAASPRSPGAWRTAAEAFAAAGDLHAAVRAGDAATRIDLARLAADLAMPDERPDAIAGIAAHLETLIGCGATDRAVDLARHLISLPRTAYLDPKRDTLADAKNGAFMTSRRLLASALMRGGRWEELRLACSTDEALAATESWADRAHTLYWRAIAEWHLGQNEDAAATGSELETLFRQSLSEGTTLEIDNEITTTIKSLRAYAAIFQSDSPTLPRQPLRHIAPTQLAALLAERGSLDAALEVNTRHLATNPTSPEAIAVQCALLARAGQLATALPLFDTTFRRNASLANRKHPAFGEALSPLVKALRLRGNWTLPAAGTSAVSKLPDPATIAPLHWAPPIAPAFDLPQPGGGTLNSDQLRGRPVLLITFVGIGCAFCVEQLKIFQPHAAAFEAAGIPIHTVSTDPLPALEAMRKAAAADPSAPPAFPFPIAADPRLETFRALRCFDHSNNKALHGIYLLSPEGRILWGNTSHEPFLQPQFLLTEARRLQALWPRVLPDSSD